MFLLIFFWTPPHFWALALYRKDDYAAAGVPMLPVVHGTRETKRQMLLYTILLVPLSLAPCFFSFAGWQVYGAVAAALSLIFLALAIAVWRGESDRLAKRMFGYSIFYLFGLFAILIADNFLMTAV